MKTSIEFERKSILSFEQYIQYYKLLSQQSKPSVTLQFNYYYDDTRFSLFEHNETLRVRQIGEKLTLEYKHNKEHIGNVRKSEENATSIPILPQKITIDSIEATMVGCLLTERNDFLFKNVKISLDKNIYLGIVDYELELEITGVDELPQFLSALTETDTCSSLGKYSRFVSKLRVVNTIYEVYLLESY